MKSRPPKETAAIYALMAMLGLIGADYAILNTRDRMLPSTPPPAKRVPPRPSTFTDRRAYDVVLAKNIFNADQKIADPVGATQENKPKEDGPPVPSSLPLQLVGTIVHVNPLRSVATLNLRNKNEQMAFRAEQVIPDNLATVTKIERNKVIFRNNATQRLEFIELKEEAKLTFGKSSGPVGVAPKQVGEVMQKSETEFELKRDDVNRLTGNLPELLQQARAVPNIGPNGQPNGFRIMDIQPGSIYERLGLRRGDVIKGVNGEPVDSPAKAMELYNALRTSGNINIQIERGGRSENMNYNIQ